MSQVGVMSRPATQQSLTARLPEIQHPLSRMSNPGMLDVRGSSRGGERPASHQGSLTGRPLGNETTYSATRRLHSSSSDRALRTSYRLEQAPLVHESIPEGVEVTQGDPGKTKLPIFGSRASLPSRGEMATRSGSRAIYSSQGQLEVQELEGILRDRVKASFFEVKKKFKDNDPEQKGNVSKEALFRIIVTTINRPLNQQQFSRLMERLGFRDKSVVNFTEFFTCFREPGSATEYPRWMDPIQRTDKATMSASQVHMHLKDRARQRVKDIADLIPQTNPDGSGHILKPEFRNVLNRMGFFMDDDEFEKLWSKYDTEGTGTINGERMMAKMGISIATDGSAPRLGMSQEGAAPIKPLKKKEADRQRSLHIERWLKRKFREGFSSMRKAFEAFDHDSEGEVTHDEFLEVLAEFGLRLEKPHLAEFLARCSVEPTKTSVPWREFLHRFQDRSEGGMAHNILTNSKHRYNRADSPGANSNMSALETQLLNMFQRDFLTVLGKFHNIDKMGTDVVSQEEFRAAIESHFDLQMSDSQYQGFVDRLPLDADGNVRYAEFMAQFDTRGKAPSLFADPPQCRSPQPAPAASPPRSPQESVVDRLVVSHDEPPVFDTAPRRSPHELFKLIKDLLNRHYQQVEEAFYDLDEINSRRLTQDMMYDLMQRFDVTPEITRGEIRDLWKTFITNQDKTLDFLQFTRHFGYSLRSAAFPNAKVSPPKRGDADYMLRSRKLNCAADMLQDSLRAKIDYMWEELGREFVAMDPRGTGLVPTQAFREVLTELCVHLSDYELNMLVTKFQTNDGRVSYVEFLKPYAMKRQTWRHGNNMLSLLQHPQSELPITDIVEAPTKGLTGITAKLRQKLSGDWKNLRRAFKKMDSRNEGYLSLPEFRSVLKLANVLLDEDEVYHVMSQFDQDMSGRIPYNRFLNETLKPGSRASLVRSSAEV